MCVCVCVCVSDWATTRCDNCEQRCGIKRPTCKMEGQIKSLLQMIMCCRAFMGFGQMIASSGSWGHTRSSFYANGPLARVFIGERRGGVVRKAWHHANAALWRKCASPEQAEVRPARWHLWTFSERLLKPNRLRGEEQAVRTEFEKVGGFYARMFFFSLSLSFWAEFKVWNYYFFFWSKRAGTDCMN